MKHRASSTYKMDAPGRHSGQTNGQSDQRTCLFVRLCLWWSLTLMSTIFATLNSTFTQHLSSTFQRKQSH